MLGSNTTIDKTIAWRKLSKYAKKMRNKQMIDMFAEDKKRAEKFSLNLDGLWLDYSKNIIDTKTMLYLLALADKANLKGKIEEMFTAQKINTTENRAVLHIALRNRSNHPIYLDGKDVMPEINQVLSKIKDFSTDVRLGKFCGHTGKKLTNIVNIGIGGSDLGPKMAVEALKRYHLKDILNCWNTMPMR